jgi:hypothetical protein
MNITEDRLRAALLKTAEQIPPGAVPALELPAEVSGGVRGGRHWPAGRPSKWLSALAAAAAVCLIISLPFMLAGEPGQVPSTGQLAQFPPYYVALQQESSCFLFICSTPSNEYYTDPDRAVVVSTLTGNTLATIAAPKPYGTFAFVQSTANNRDFILGAQRLTPANSFTYPPTKLYLLRLNPSARPGHQVRLTALQVPLLPGARGYQQCWFALSPNGHLLAAISTTTATNNPTYLRVFNLITGSSRTWLLPRWAARNDTVVDAVGPPSWSTDSRTLAFFNSTAAGGAELVLLDTSASAASFGADTRSVPLPKPPRGDEVSFLPGSPLLTPDGKHVLEEVLNLREAKALTSPYDPFALEVVNLRTGAVHQLQNHSRIFYTLAPDPSGSAVIVAIGNATPDAQGFVAWTAHGTAPLQVPSNTIAIAW